MGMERAKLALDGIEKVRASEAMKDDGIVSPKSADQDLSEVAASLRLMIDELSGIDPKLLDRVGRLLIEEQPMYKVILEHRNPKADPKAKGIGEMLAVYIASNPLPGVRNHLGSLLRRTAELCVEAKAEGRRSLKGLTFEAVRSLPRPEPEAEATAAPVP